VATIDQSLRQRIQETSPLFSSLEAGELEALLAIGRRTKVPGNHSLFQRGSAADRFFVLLSGRARVVFTAHDGRELVVRLLEPGDVFGEIAVLDGGERTATVSTTEPCELLVVERSRLRSHLIAHPELNLKLLSLLAARLRQTTELLTDNVFLDVATRLAKVLRALVQSHGKPTRSGTRIDLKISQQELADMTGTSRVSVNKQLMSWQEQGLLSTERRVVTVHDMSAMEALAGVWR